MAKSHSLLKPLSEINAALHNLERPSVSTYYEPELWKLLKKGEQRASRRRRQAVGEASPAGQETAGEKIIPKQDHAPRANGGSRGRTHCRQYAIDVTRLLLPRGT